MKTLHLIARCRRAARSVRTATLVALLTAPSAMAAQRAAAGTAQDALHGIVVSDPYRHLERLELPATREWVRAQDRSSRERFGRAADRERIRAGILAFASRPQVLPPLRRGPYEFYGVRGNPGPGATNDVMVRPRGSSGAGRRILSGGGGRGLGFVPSPDGRLLGYLAGPPNSLWSTIRVIDVASGRDVGDSGTRVHRTQAGLVWAPDGSGYFYQHTPESGTGNGNVAPSEIRFRRLATPAETTVFT